MTIYSPTTAADICGSLDHNGDGLVDHFEAGLQLVLRNWVDTTEINVELLAQHLAGDVADIFADVQLNEYIRDQEA